MKFLIIVAVGAFVVLQAECRVASVQTQVGKRSIDADFELDVGPIGAGIEFGLGFGNLADGVLGTVLNTEIGKRSIDVGTDLGVDAVVDEIIDAEVQTAVESNVGLDGLLKKRSVLGDGLLKIGQGHKNLLNGVRGPLKHLGKKWKIGGR
ncbi:PREDICTED: uncharacterized protein LOC107193361 [Dufourea novaeangliae]|nr:PREDICTED: uncharacterized protein LOC107193361 [Dufourea novaeangliae]